MISVSKRERGRGIRMKQKLDHKEQGGVMGKAMAFALLIN